MTPAGDERVGQPLPDPIFGPSPAEEVSDELQFHLAMRTRDLIAAGATPEEAERAARARFADLDRVARECHDLAKERESAMKRSRYVTNLIQDIHFALRMLRHRKLFAVMAILPICLGIGAATAMYSVVDGVMLRPLPFVHPERLVAIWATEDAWRTEKAVAIAWNSVVIGQADYDALRDRARTLSAVAAWGRDGGMLSDATGAFDDVSGVRVTASIFPLLGVQPALGRSFQPGEDVLNGPHVAMLGWETWQHRFGGDSGVVGRSVTYNETAYTVVGIMPPKVRLDRTIPPPAIWIPAFQGKDDIPTQHNRSYRGLGRLAAGATVAQANAEVAGIIADVKASWKGKADGTSGRATNWQDDQIGSIRGSLIILAGAVTLLLLIACVNVATVMFGEAARRRGEIAARAALGASPSRLVRQLLTESLVLAIVGASVGLLLGWGLTRGLVALAPAKLPGIADVRFDARVFLFTASCAVVTGLAFGVLPTFALLRWGRGSAARGGSGQTARGEAGIQRVLVAVEVALSLVMLVGCSLLGHSLVRLSEVDPGFAPGGLSLVGITAPRQLWADSARSAAFNAEAFRQLQAIPGVTAVTGSNSGLFDGGGSSSPLKIVGHPPDEPGHDIQQRVVLAGYFHTMRVPIVAGRDFAATDNVAAPRVAIISAAEAQRDFPATSPIGQRVVWQGKEWAVIGVAADVHYSNLSSDFQPTIYIPEAQRSGNLVSFLVRTGNDGANIAAAISSRLLAINPTVVASVNPVPTLVERSYAEERYRTLLGSLFGIVGAVLAGVGMFGVISRTVARRMREAGIRVALGAQSRSLTVLMLRETLIGAAIGMAVGLPLAALLGRLLTPYLFGASAADPVAYLLALALLALATAAATVPPARRAGRVDPVVVLRAE